ncbi:MAG: hypothetical protein ABIF19_02080, partial [Planctomycetota bacterium]
DGEQSEQDVLKKCKVSRKLYGRWLADEAFTAELDRRMAEAYRRSALLIARHAPAAAESLLKLTKCKKEETARKACLDIISMPNAGSPGGPGPATDTTSPTDPPKLSPETAGKLLAVLAAENAQKT